LFISLKFRFITANLATIINFIFNYHLFVVWLFIINTAAAVVIIIAATATFFNYFSLLESPLLSHIHRNADQMIS
jgi:hypothetical protein